MERGLALEQSVAAPVRPRAPRYLPRLNAPGEAAARALRWFGFDCGTTGYTPSAPVVPDKGHRLDGGGVAFDFIPHVARNWREQAGCFQWGKRDPSFATPNSASAMAESFPGSHSPAAARSISLRATTLTSSSSSSRGRSSAPQTTWNAVRTAFHCLRLMAGRVGIGISAGRCCERSGVVATAA